VPSDREPHPRVTDGPDPVHVLRIDRRFRLPADVEQVWDTISDLERFPTWWRWLRDFEVDGDGLAAGTQLRAAVVPPVPYRFRVGVTFDEVDAPHHIAASLSGDLLGPADLWLHPHPEGCEAQVRWTVVMQQPWMRRAAHVARPVMVWGHDQVVAVTFPRLRRVLR
jgi:carbon monoxide dehydrogenase subunit G